MKEVNKKSKAKKLTDAVCRDLPRLDKRYYKLGDYPGNRTTLFNPEPRSLKVFSFIF